MGLIYTPRTNKSRPNAMDNSEADRNFGQKQDRVKRIFPGGEIFDYAICFFHPAVSLFRIHSKMPL